MAGDAGTLPLRGGPLGRGLLRRGRTAPGAEETVAEERSGAMIAIAGLGLIVLLSLFVVVITADRPSGLAPTSHAGYFPHWMAGPLGGLLPSLTRNGNTLRYMFTGAIVVMYASYLVVLRNIASVRARWVLGAIVGAHAVFLLAPPMALTDVFNYINYGRMEVVDHLNPYTTIPILEPHSDPSFALSNWHELLSPYGPLFTMLTFAVVPLGVAASFWALKALLIVTSLATLGLVWACARLLGRDPVAAVAFVGLNPIVLVWGLGGDHNDFLMVFFVMLAMYLLLLGMRRREGGERAVAHWREWVWPLSGVDLGAGAALVTAAALKASAAVLVPIVLMSLLRSRRALVQVVLGMLVAGAVVGAASLEAFGLHIPDLSTQGSLVTAESIPNMVGLAIGLGGETGGVRIGMTLALAVALVLCCRMAYRRRDPLTACGWASVALLLTLSWVLPWYVLWVLPLAALSRSVRLRRAAILVGVYVIVAWAPASALLWNAIGFRPERTAVGRIHQRYVRELLN